MKFLEVLVVGLDFQFGRVVAQSLEAVEASDHLGFYWPSYESNHLQNLPLLRNPSCVFSLRNFEKACVKSLDFIFTKRTKDRLFLTDL